MQSFVRTLYINLTRIRENKEFLSPFTRQDDRVECSEVRSAWIQIWTIEVFEYIYKNLYITEGYYTITIKIFYTYKALEHTR